MNTENYVLNSLELHLFFGRIMKEHALFLRAGFTPANFPFSRRAEYFKNEFERLLGHAITLSNGVISQKILKSGELVTDFTALAENQTERFTGISINKELTRRELELKCGRSEQNISTEKSRQVQRLNRTALNLVDGLISFKENILNNVLSCRMFTMNYPLLIEHIIHEARLYQKYIRMLEKEGCLSEQCMKEVECFWNRIMMEHALFIRGLLDPSEAELFNSADDFANDYAKLLETCNKTQAQATTEESLKITTKLRDFKEAGTIGIENCEIRSVILPLLADHVLREANHYIRLLKS